MKDGVLSGTHQACFPIALMTNTTHLVIFIPSYFSSSFRMRTNSVYDKCVGKDRKEQKMLQGMTDRLTQFGRYYRRQPNGKKTKIISISRKPSKI
jgi:hypothetical protein